MLTLSARAAANPPAYFQARSSLRARASRHTRAHGFTLVQVMVACGLVVICGLASIQALILINAKAAAMRTLNSARAVVQRNIDQAAGVPFSTSAQPAILAVTTAGGSVYDDDGNGDNLVNVAFKRDGVTPLVTGTLTRTVVAEANVENAVIRRVTFSLQYIFRRRTYIYALSTLRTQD